MSPLAAEPWCYPPEVIAGFTDALEAAYVRAQVERVKASQGESAGSAHSPSGSNIFDDLDALTWERFAAEMNAMFPGQPESHWRKVFADIKAKADRGE